MCGIVRIDATALFSQTVPILRDHPVELQESEKELGVLWHHPETALVTTFYSNPFWHGVNCFHGYQIPGI